MRINLDGTKCGKPVRCIFDRREDLEFTSKRHPSLCTYKVAVKDGKVTAMVDEVDRACGLRRKHKEYAQPQTGRYRRGIGFSMHFHGAGFTGSGERILIRAVARLHKYKDGTVEVLVSNGEIGEGLRTTFPKIVAHELNLPLEKVFYDHPDTSRVPDSGPTVASRSLMTVGELLRRAAIKLRTQWKDGEDQIVEEKFVEPDFMIPFYLDKFRGDA